MIKLVYASKKYMNEYKEAYIKSLQKVNEGIIRKHDLVFENPDIVDVIQEDKDLRNINKLKPDQVLTYNYFLVDDDKFIGVLGIRTKLTPSLLRYAGNIGYGINPTYWKQGYGTLILKLGLEKAKELGLKDKVLVTCDDDNIGSSKIIENNGGILENKVVNEKQGEVFLTRRYWIKL